MLGMLRLANFYTFFLLIFSLLASAAPSFATSFSPGGIRIEKRVRNMKEIRRQNVVTQSLDFSCGAAGLSTLLNYYLNDPVSETAIINDLFKIVPLEKVKERRGFSLFDLKKYAESKGYRVTGYQMDFDFLRNLKKPVLVPIKFKNYRHFVVVKGVFGDRIFLADPAVGNITVKESKFMTMWTSGIGFLVEHKEGEMRENYPMRVVKEDARMAEYQTLRQLSDTSLLRTTIFPNEW